MNTGWRTVALILEIGLTTGGMATLAGCNERCSGVYSCPDDSPYGSLSPTDLPSPLVEVSADEPCTATLVNGDAGAATVQVIDRRFNETLVCHVHGRLADGENVEATINFQRAMIGCCFGYVASIAGFRPNDAGTDGP